MAKEEEKLPNHKEYIASQVLAVAANLLLFESTFQIFSYTGHACNTPWTTDLLVDPGDCRDTVCMGIYIIYIYILLLALYTRVRYVTYN